MMATSDQVRELLNRGHSYEMVARELHIPAGQAYLTATGVPVDDGDVTRPQEPRDTAGLSGSPQTLVNPPTVNPTRNSRVMDWVQARAARELTGGN